MGTQLGYTFDKLARAANVGIETIRFYQGGFTRGCGRTGRRM